MGTNVDGGAVVVTRGEREKEQPQCVTIARRPMLSCKKSSEEKGLSKKFDGSKLIPIQLLEDGRREDQDVPLLLPGILMNFWFSCPRLGLRARLA